MHFGVKTRGKPDSVYRPPPPPAGFEDLVSAELVVMALRNVASDNNYLLHTYINAYILNISLE